MDQPTRLAILGLGRWGEHLVRNFLALSEAQVVAVVDPNPDRLNFIRQQVALPDTIQYFDQWLPALALPDLQAVVIATPATTHYALIKIALNRGLHVLTEKPMTLDLTTGEELCQLAKHHQLVLVVDHTYLFHPAVREGRQVIQSGRLGQYRYAYAARTNLGPVRQDVDALWDLAIHDLSILHYWLGHRPQTVAAWGQLWLQPEARPEFPHGLRDLGWLRLTFPNQIPAMIHVSWLNPDKQRRLALVGDQGTLVMDELASQGPLTLYAGQLHDQTGGFQPSPIEAISLPVPTTEPLRQVCRHFLDCIAHRQPSSVTSGELATDLVTVLQAASQSVQQGGIPISVTYR